MGLGARMPLFIGHGCHFITIIHSSCSSINKYHDSNMCLGEGCLMFSFYLSIYFFMPVVL